MPVPRGDTGNFRGQEDAAPGLHGIQTGGRLLIRVELPGPSQWTYLLVSDIKAISMPFNAWNEFGLKTPKDSFPKESLFWSSQSLYLSQIST